MKERKEIIKSDISENFSSSFNPVYPDNSTKEGADTEEKALTANADSENTYKILSRGFENNGAQFDSQPPLILLNTGDSYNKNDYINITGTDEESSESNNMTNQKFQDNLDELGIINEESMSKSYSYLSKNKENEEEDKEKQKIIKKKIIKEAKRPIEKSNTYNNLLAPKFQSKKKKVFPLGRSQTKMNEDMELLEMYSNLSNLSSSKKHTKNDNDSFSKMSKDSEDKAKNKNSKTMNNYQKVLFKITQENSKLSFRKNGLNSTQKASKNSENKVNSISSISVHSSINIDPDEVRKPIKRTQTNMISVGGLSDYKFYKKSSTKKYPNLGSKYF